MNRGSLAAFSMVLASSLAAMVGTSGCGSEPPTATGGTGGSSVNPGRAGSGGSGRGGSGGTSAGGSGGSAAAGSGGSSAAGSGGSVAGTGGSGVGTGGSGSGTGGSGGGSGGSSATDGAGDGRRIRQRGQRRRRGRQRSDRTRRSGARQRQPELRRPRSPRRPLLRRVAADRPGRDHLPDQGRQGGLATRHPRQRRAGRLHLDLVRHRVLQPQVLRRPGDQDGPHHGQGRRDRLGVPAGRRQRGARGPAHRQGQGAGHAERGPRQADDHQQDHGQELPVRHALRGEAVARHGRRQRARDVPARAHPGQRQPADPVHRRAWAR